VVDFTLHIKGDLVSFYPELVWRVKWHVALVDDQEIPDHRCLRMPLTLLMWIQKENKLRRPWWRSNLATSGTFLLNRAKEMRPDIPRSSGDLDSTQQTK